MLEKELESFGLTEHEARVYVAALARGPSSALEIARETTLKRSTVYVTLEHLEKKGFVFQEYVGLKRKFVAASPERLEDLVSNLKKKYYEVLPELLSLHKLKGRTGLVKYYEGIEGLKSLYETVLRELRSGDPYFIISKQENWHTLDARWFEDFVERRSRRSLDTRILFEDTKKARYNIAAQRALNQKVKLLPASLAFNSDVIITPQRYVTHSLVEPITAVSIENEEIIGTQLNIFLALWSALPEEKISE